MTSEADKIYQDIVMGKWNFKEICREVGIEELDEPFLRQS